MGQDLPGPGNDGRGRRPPVSSCHHLRDERRELPPSRRARTQARPRPAADPRDNRGQYLIVAPRQYKSSIPLARQSRYGNHANIATPDSHPDCRCFPIQIAALHAAGRQRRSSTYPQAFLVNLPRCAIAEALVLALRVVEVQPGANAGLGFGHIRISMEVDLLIFEAAPQPLDEDVVHAPALAVHADHDPVPFQGAGEVAASELAAPSLRWGRLWSVLKISGRP